MTYPSDKILQAVGAPTVAQMQQIRHIDLQLRQAGFNPERFAASYPQAAALGENLEGARLFGMPLVAGPLGVLVRSEW